MHLASIARLALATAALTVAIQAQCYETNFGTLVGTGDDTLFAAQPMNISFPIGGSNYDSIRVQTNGVVYLTQALGAGSGTSGTGYSTSTTTMTNNMRGTAGSSPRIAAYWRDLNLTVANGAGLYLNTSNPGRTVITWDRVVHYGQTSPVFTVQMQLHDTGAVDCYYGGTTNNTALGVTAGISAGNAIADPGMSDLSAGSVGVSTSPIAYEVWGALNTFDLANKTVRFAPNAGGGYDVIPSACVASSNTNYGSGCGGVSSTVYQSFAPNTFDLAGTSLRGVPNAQGGYDIVPGIGTNFTHTVAGLGLGDDQTVAVALPGAFNFPGGSTTSIGVCSNGYLWMDGTITTADFSPTVAELFSGAARLGAFWADGVADGATNINNVFAEHDPVANKFYVTYNNLPIFGGVGGTMDMQIELDLTSMAWEVRYGAGCSCGNVSIVGWTPGGSVANNGPVDLSAGGALSTSSSEALAMVLAADVAPVLGATVTYTTNNVPAGALLNLTIVSLGQINPGIPVAGTPNCLQLVDLTVAGLSGTIGSPSTSVAFALPSNAAFAGLPLSVQTASLVPGANAAGVITSNGVQSYCTTF